MAADGMSATTSILLHPVPPYNFRLALTYLRASPSAVLERIDDDSYQRALRVLGHDVLLTLRPEGEALRLDVAGLEAAHAAERVTEIFALDADPGPFHLAAARDPIFARLVARFQGLRPVLIADPYEALLWAIIGQQINVAFARTLKTRLIELCGRTLTVGSRDYPLLPDAEDVATLDADVLRANQFSRQKTAYLLEVSAAIARGQLDLEALRHLPFDEAVAVLMRYKGIGRWTAEYVLMRGLGVQDSIPAGDLGLRAIIGRAYNLQRTATEAEVREIASAWAPYRGWASFYWWMALQQKVDPREFRPLE